MQKEWKKKSSTWTGWNNGYELLKRWKLCDINRKILYWK